MPEAPSSLRGGAAALSTKYAWSEWGGVPIPDVPPPPPSNPADSAMLGARKMDGPGGSRLEERAAARQRHKVQKVLDALRSQVRVGSGNVACERRCLRARGLSLRSTGGDAWVSRSRLPQARGVQGLYNLVRRAQAVRMWPVVRCKPVPALLMLLPARARVCFCCRRRALKRRFNIEMSEETTRGVIREFDVDGDG